MKVKTRRSLGKGLDAILNATVMQSGTSDIKKILQDIAVEKLVAGKYQPRVDFAPEALAELAASIAEQGILQPIIARRVGEGYEIIAGERRWRAAQMAGLAEVPVLIYDINDEAALAYGLIENIQRKDLTVLEEAVAYDRLIHEFSLTHEQVAKAVGKSRPAISNMLRLLTLAEPVKQLLAAGKIDVGHAKLLLGLTVAEQARVAEMVTTKKLTVRATEVLLQKLSQVAPAEPPIAEQQVLDWERQLTVQVKAPVSIKIAADGKSSLKIQFGSIKELEIFITNWTREG